MACWSESDGAFLNRQKATLEATNENIFSEKNCNLFRWEGGGLVEGVSLT